MKHIFEKGLIINFFFGLQDSNTDDTEHHQSTMWLGTEDGCIHVYNCTDNIRIKKNKIKIQHISAVYSILYLDNRVFASLANGDLCIYSRDHSEYIFLFILSLRIKHGFLL
jgi:WD40 repeated domain